MYDVQCNRYIKILQWYATVYMKTLTCTPHVHVHVATHVHVRRTFYIFKNLFVHVHICMYMYDRTKLH